MQDGEIGCAEGRCALVRPAGILYDYAREIALRGSFVVHGASLVAPSGAGVILCGPSGSGKTTIAGKLARLGYGVIDDEMSVVLSAAGGGYSVSAVPWVRNRFVGSLTKGNDLKIIMLLTHEQDKVSRYQAMSFQASLRMLAENIWYFPWLANSIPHLLRGVAALVAARPCGILHHSLQDMEVSEMIEEITRRRL